MTESTGRWSQSWLETFLDAAAIPIRVARRSLLAEERDETPIRFVSDRIVRRAFTGWLADVGAESACPADR